MLRMLGSAAAVCGLWIALTTPVQALQFTATLNGAQEVGAVNTPGTGNGSADFDPATNLLAVHVDFTGLTSNAVDAHIHCCTTTALNAIVAIGFTPAGFPNGDTSGVFNATFDLLSSSIYTASFLANSGGTAAGARDALIAARSADPTNPASIRAYFNIHTSTNPGGEIRGNISPVPEPAAAALMLCALAGIGALRRVR